jgi:hypothetical protein
MAIYEFTTDGISPLIPTNFSAVNLLERRDLQRLLRERIEVISPDTMVIAEEFGEWDESRRRIDLLGIDREANLVVIELKRTEDGGHMELQAIRYASMVSALTFERAVDIYGGYLREIKSDHDPRSSMLEFLGWDEPDDEKFCQDVRIVLASAEFSKELTSSVLWLNERDLDIRCVRLKPYTLDSRVLVDVQQIIPLPDTIDYQVQIREKIRTEREARTGNRDWTKYDIRIGNEWHRSSNKRNAMLIVCKYLCAQGIKPEDISQLISWRSERSLWYSVDGTMNAPEFLQAAAKVALGSGRSFTSSRWFCDDGELIQSGNRTHALSNQWGGKWGRAMDILKETYGQYDIDFVAVT